MKDVPLPQNCTEHIYFIGGLYGVDNPFFGTTITPYELLTNLGLKTSRVLESCTRYIAFDVNEFELEKVVRYGISKSNRFLLRFEAEIVWPKNYQSKVIDNYGTLITFGKMYPDEGLGEAWPQFWDNEINLPRSNHERFNQTVFINSNKISLIKGELYSLRKRAILDVKSLSIYGRGWDKSTIANMVEFIRAVKFSLRNKKIPNLSSWFAYAKVPKHYLGSVDNKNSTLEMYKTALVIENSFDLVTEKIFDCFFSGTYPVYIGPDLTNFGIPPDLYTSCAPDIFSIRSALFNAQAIDFEKWMGSLQEWLNSNKTISTWHYRHVFSRIVSKIDVS